MRITTRRLTAPALLLCALLLASIASAAAAVAMPAPEPRVGAEYPSQPPAQSATVIMHSGSPLWTYIVVGLAAVLVTLAVAWAVTWTRRTHHREASMSISPA